ncbi:MAG: hypothetical protein K6357_01920 [Elusimicrobiota bacterium]
MFIILKYRFKSLFNRIKNLDKWKKAKNVIFTSVGFFLLSILYFSFLRILRYLNGVEFIGELLIWKLSAMVFVISFSMIAVSSLIISMTTLFYSYDLKFLFSMPLKETVIFLDKMISTIFYSSWSLIIILFPYVFALMKVKNLGLDFLCIFCILIIPYAVVACSIGIALSLCLMSLFPNSKTRDIVWIVSSLSFAFVYVAIRFSKPERLLRPDMLGVIANYLSYLQAPTASYLPSWWFTKALISYQSSNYLSFWGNFTLLYAIFFIICFILIVISRKLYLSAFSGAQSGGDKQYKYKKTIEFIISNIFSSLKNIIVLIYKERLNVQRDVRYYSQIILIIALSFVYIFSVKSLPLDNYDAKNFVSFLNMLIVGFVVSAISLRFVFTSISSESRAIWILKSIPVSGREILFSKLIFYYIPVFLFSLILVVISNYYLEVDFFMFRLSVFAMSIMSFTISIFAVSLGALFPDFRIENIHQVESSFGGFLFMAISAVYCAIVGAVFSYPVRSYFLSLFSQNFVFEKELFYISLIIFILGSFVPSYFLFEKAAKNIDNIEA